MRNRVALGAYSRIWRAVGRIPKGKVASYGTVALLGGFPNRPRMAGYALHHLPPGMDIPWHRVVNSRGQISLPGDRGATQKKLLSEEGVHFTRGAVDMREFGWPRRRK